MVERGWYPDPGGPGERWYDGTRWTGVTRQTAESAARLMAFEHESDRHVIRARRRHRLQFLSLALVMVVVALGATMLVNPGQLKPISQVLGIGEPHRLLPEVTPAARSTNYAVLHTDSAGDPISYDPCKPIRYVINPTGAPPDYLNFVQPAVARVQAATGLKFVYDGLSSETWAHHRRERTEKPVLIVFADALEGVDDHADAVGIGGSTYLDSSGPERPHYVTGQIALLREWFRDSSANRDTAAEQAVVMHELGHVVGLDHVQDPQELMYPENHGQTGFGDGDLSGLAVLGSGDCAW